MPQYKKRTSYNIHAALTALIVMTTFLYVWQINTQAENTFAIQELEQRKQGLEDEIRDLTWEVSGARSLAAVTARAGELNLVVPDEVVFLEVGLSEVAVAGQESVSP